MIDLNEPIESLYYPLAIDAGAGRIRREHSYEEHIAQMIRQLLLTDPGERIFSPNFGGGLRRAVFQPNGQAAAQLTQTLVFQNLQQWLGHLIEVADVQIEAAEEFLNVRIDYVVIALQERKFLNVRVGV